MWALILAGGSSRRMGRPKQDLPFGATTLLEGVVEAVRGFAEEVVVVGDEPGAARLDLRAAPDWKPGCGPLSGLAGGLAVCPGGRHALLACDMPFVTADLLRRMDDVGGPAAAVVPEVEGRRHPLCALYDRSCLDPARACLEQGRRSMEDLLGAVDVCIIRPEQVAPLDLGRQVTNLNTLAEYERALDAHLGSDPETART